MAIWTSCLCLVGECRYDYITALPSHIRTHWHNETSSIVCLEAKVNFNHTDIEAKVNFNLSLQRGHDNLSSHILFENEVIMMWIFQYCKTAKIFSRSLFYLSSCSFSSDKISVPMLSNLSNWARYGSFEQSLSSIFWTRYSRRVSSDVSFVFSIAIDIWWSLVIERWKWLWKQDYNKEKLRWKMY